VRARCVLLDRLEDRRTQVFFLEGRYPRVDDIRAVYDAFERAAGGTLRRAELTGRIPVAASKAHAALSMLKDLEIVREQRVRAARPAPARAHRRSPPNHGRALRGEARGRSREARTAHAVGPERPLSLEDASRVLRRASGLGPLRDVRQLHAAARDRAARGGGQKAATDAHHRHRAGRGPGSAKATWCGCFDMAWGMCARLWATRSTCRSRRER
jgi:hypothetical protein